MALIAHKKEPFSLAFFFVLCGDEILKKNAFQINSIEMRKDEKKSDVNAQREREK